MDIKPLALVIDFDGTIACYKKREHLRDVNFTEYIKQSHTDIPNRPVVEIIKRFHKDTEIIILSARAESARQETLEWLVKHNIPFNKLILKGNDDHRDDGLIKKEILEKDIMVNYDVLFCLDDRGTCIKHMRDLGLKALQCGEGY